MKSGCIGALFRTSAQADYNAVLVSRFQYRRTLTSSATDCKWFLSRQHNNLGEQLRSTKYAPWVEVYWLEGLLRVCKIVFFLESLTEACLEAVSKPDGLFEAPELSSTRMYVEKPLS